MRYSSNPFDGILAYFDRHRKAAYVIALVVLLSVLAACWKTGQIYATAGNAYQYVTVPLSREEYERDFSYLEITSLDQNTSPSDNAVAISLNDVDELLEITEGGDYILSGKLTGQILIHAKEQNVHLFLADAEIASKSGPAINCQNAEKLVITILDGTSNYISDSGDYRADEEACIYSTSDITINGGGSLTVNGYFKDAIRSKDVLKILGGTYTIKCKRTAFHGNDGVVIGDGEFSISSEKNAFKTTKSGSDGRGSLIIGGGTFNIIAGQYAFVTVKGNAYIYSCNITSRSIVKTFNVAGSQKVQWGCIDER